MNCSTNVEFGVWQFEICNREHDLAKRPCRFSTFVLRRLLHALPLLVCVIVFNFFLIHLAPGDPIQALVGEFPAPAAYLAEMRRAFRSRPTALHSTAALHQKYSVRRFGFFFLLSPAGAERHPGPRAGDAAIDGAGTALLCHRGHSSRAFSPRANPTRSLIMPSAPFRSSVIACPPSGSDKCSWRPSPSSSAGCRRKE